MRYVSLILLGAALVLSLCVVPANAQDTARAESVTRETALRDWYNGLGKDRQDQLKRRFRAFKHLPKERQQQILQAVKEGKPILSDRQRENLRKLRKLGFLERVRLYVTSAELNALRRGPRGAEAQAAVQSGDVSTLRRMMLQQRMGMYARGLSATERREFIRMSDDKKLRKMQEDRKARLEQLEGIYPRIRELRDAAEKGDKDARHQLRHVLADLRTLDLLLQRLSPDKRNQVMDELKDLGMDEAANKVRRALRDQFQNNKRKTPRNRNNTPPRMVPGRDGRRGERRNTREQ